ncbi:hypothetical protein CKC_00180 [Candidatus Liberibacter solanacearum CLso-ZC1]|uniref:Uncharacterized protein n=1 Tax=Liberibacter solanacearum (strain CLso-ZC1) TaxID=658172 RepID=E4UBP7_LIBSC|nr:hypothetical protein CKC_00180 [Candidatus Liberibacter solanacearum CLso-ZC1]
MLGIANDFYKDQTHQAVGTISGVVCGAKAFFIR